MQEVAARTVRANARLMEGLARDRLELGMLRHLAQLLDSMRELTFIHEAAFASLGEALANFSLVAGSVEFRAVEGARSGHRASTVSDHLDHVLKKLVINMFFSLGYLVVFDWVLTGSRAAAAEKRGRIVWEIIELLGVVIFADYTAKRAAQARVAGRWCIFDVLHRQTELIERLRELVQNSGRFLEKLTAELTEVLDADFVVHLAENLKSIVIICHFVKTRLKFS
jgi:hypothetical protein